jgi:hypothetical protein
MTGFAAATFLRAQSTDSQGVAMASFAAFFVPYGLPRLIIVDQDGVFKDSFTQLFRILQVPVLPVSAENHKAIRCERFHRYLNKVQKINSADTGTLEQWKQGVLFAVYSWNAGPIDGTDLPRSVVAIARDFPFPIDLAEAIPRHGTAQGQQALDHFDAMSPLLYKQRQLLVELNAERRQRHIDLRNDNKKNPVFSPGDIVIVRKQVKSDASAGVSAKLIFRSKGPYRVMERIGETHSYRLQKLPFLEGMGVPGRLVKENAARMEKLPSTLILHKRADGADSRFAAMHRDLAKAPLSKWLGVPRYGSYQVADDEDPWAFEPLASMWTDEVVDTDSEEEDEPPAPPAAPRRPVPVEKDDEESPEEEEETEEAELPPPEDLPAKRILRQLYRSIEASPTKLFFLRVPNSNMWRLAAVDLLETDPHLALHFGQYVVRWWTPALSDRKKRLIRNCRFAPDVRKVLHKQVYGRRHAVNPSTVKQALQSDESLHWMSDTVNLTVDRIIGPFDFETVRGIDTNDAKRRVTSEQHRIPEIIWTELESRGAELNVKVSDIHAVVNDHEAY